MRTIDSATNAMNAVTGGIPLTSMSSGMRMDGWKDIASYFGRSVRTVQRWERFEGMPVHRYAHATGDSLFAYTHELDEWRRSRSHTGPKHVALASVQCHIQSLPQGEHGGLLRLVDVVLEQLGKAPVSSVFVVVFHETLSHSENEDLNLAEDEP